MKLVILGLVFMSKISLAQSTCTQMGARAAGLGYATAVVKDEFTLFNNIGAIAGNSAAAFFAYETNTQLPGANRAVAGMIVPTSIGVGGVGFFRFGDDLYNEQLISVGFGNQLGIASLGIKANLVQYHANGYENRSAVGIDFGGRAQVTPQIIAGAYVVNLNQSEIAPGEYLPTRLVAGIGFQLDENFFLTTEVNKDINYSATWRTGFEYTILKNVFVRTGFNLNPSTLHFGLGISTYKLKADYALVYSHLLGETHQASVVVLPAKKKTK